MTKNEIRKMFSDLDREQYADWLWRSLLQFYASPSSDKDAFAPVSSLVRQQETLSEGLAQVYELYVPEHQKLLFRQALGDVLRNHSNSVDVPSVAFQDLIYLIARIGATESLGALVPTVGSGLLGKVDPTILYDSFSILKYLAPSSSAFDTVLALVDSANFDDGYLFDAMTVLIECEPSRTSEIVLRLEPRITRLRSNIWALGSQEEMDAFREAADDWCAHALQLGPRIWLSELWEQADHSPEQIWLFELLFGNSTVPVYLIENTKDVKMESIIEYAGKRTRVRFADKDRWTRRRISRWSQYSMFTKLDFTSLDETNASTVLRHAQEIQLRPRNPGRSLPTALSKLIRDNVELFADGRRAEQQGCI